MKSFIASLIALLCVATASAQSNAQTSSASIEEAHVSSTDDLINSSETAKSALEDLLKLQQENLAKLTENVTQLRQLYSEGLIARVELEKRFC